jgi:NAD(P)H-hydrate repair Nnr-like enzyme with NAD(P)H-hydrate dehydratase domain
MSAGASDGGRPMVIAVDLPSGIDPDTGAVPGEAVTADVTVTFGALKPGLLIGAGAVHSGLVELVDIGLGPWLRDEPAVRVPDLDDIAEWWPQPKPGDDKYTRGVVGVATGSATYPGAAMLSTAGALAGPAGMVRYAGAGFEAVRDRYPSVIPTPRVADAGRVQAWTCGCGLGTDERARAELRAVLDAPVPACLDADALTLLANEIGVDTLRGRPAPVVVTPHDREFARLAGAEPGADRVAATLRLAARTGAVVLLKGDRTVVGTPDGRAYVNRDPGARDRGHRRCPGRAARLAASGRPAGGAGGARGRVRARPGGAVRRRVGPGDVGRCRRGVAADAGPRRDVAYLMTSVG